MSFAPLEALAKQRLSDLWESTLTLLEQGKEEDERGNSAAAYLQYAEAIGGLQALLEEEADAKRQELLRARLVEYSARLQQLSALRQAQGPVLGSLLAEAHAGSVEKTSRGHETRHVRPNPNPNPNTNPNPNPKKP